LRCNQKRSKGLAGDPILNGPKVKCLWFIQAGAQNLVMTLWPISDETTVQIMLDFCDSAFASGDASKRSWMCSANAHKVAQKKGLLYAVNRA
jgi:hypothetical protein